MQECVAVCAMVAAYDSGTTRLEASHILLYYILYPLTSLCRAHQMLTILDAILPLYLRQLVSDKTADVKELREKIQGLSHALKTVIHNADKLTQ